jgi:hypothetical protein
MTKIWRQSYDPAHYTEADNLSLDADPGAYMDIMSCRPMTGAFPNTSLRIRSRHPPNDYFDVGGIFVVSERLKSVLEQFELRAEFFSLRIIFKKREYTNPEFFFCNILDEVDCLDFNKGKYVFSKKPGFADYVLTIKKLVVDNEKVASHDLFRVAKCAPNIICVSNKLANSIEELSLTGMRFIDPKDWGRGC